MAGDNPQGNESITLAELAMILDNDTYPDKDDVTELHEYKTGTNSLSIRFGYN